MARLLFLALVVFVSFGNAAASEGTKNPIRKVVTLLQNLQKKVSAESEKAQDLYEKFMCYCKTSTGSLQAQIEAGGTKTEQLESSIKASEEELAQAKSDLKSAQSDRAEAKATMSQSTAMREKEAAAFASEKAEYDANIDAMGKAISAISSGMSGAFLQTPAAQAVKKAAIDAQMQDYDRQQLMSFLSGSTDYAPASGEILGILKTMHDEMSASRSDLVATEKAAIKDYDALMSAKTKEVNTLTKKIETKMDKVGELGVSIAEMKNDLGDTGEALVADKKFLADLEKGCSTKTAEHEADQKMRAQELVALADTIKLLNDDDALELFKKTLPAPSASSLLEVGSRANARARALTAVEKAASVAHRPEVDLIALVLRGKKIGFEKVIKMVDDMIATLKREQVDDDAKKEYCGRSLDEADDKKKSLEGSIADLETVIANNKEGIANTKDEIAALEDGIKKLDKSVQEATEQRKEENTEYKALMADNGAAKQLLGFALNRLNKFYNPKLYKPPAKEELSAAGRIEANMGGAMFVQISEHTHRSGDAPPPPPETAAAYTKKSEESGGVIAMIKLLVADLDKEMTEAETMEKDSQADYESFLSDAQKKRADDSKTVTDKEGALANMEGELLKAKDEKKAKTTELMGTAKFISSLHAECDWLLQYFDVRKEARAGEIDALGKAKAVLSGADYSM